MFVFRSTRTAIFFAITALLPTVLADCQSDSDWNVFLNVEGASFGYWAAVKTDGTFTDLYHAQCLSMQNRECVPCNTLQVTKVGIPPAIAPCTMTSPLSRRTDGESGDAAIDWSKENEEFSYLDNAWKRSEGNADDPGDAVIDWSKENEEFSYLDNAWKEKRQAAGLQTTTFDTARIISSMTCKKSS